MQTVAVEQDIITVFEVFSRWALSRIGLFFLQVTLDLLSPDRAPCLDCGRRRTDLPGMIKTERPKRLAPKASELLASAVASGRAGGLTIRALLDALGNRAHGMALLAFGLPNSLPMPPGIPTVSGVVILLVSLQLIFTPRRLWLPNFLGRRDLPAQAVEQFATRGVDLVRRMERVFRPRLQWASGEAGRLLVGALSAICGCILILPIPFIGNIFPAWAVIALAIGLIQRDGAAILAGTFIFGWAVTLLVLVFNGVANGIA